MPIMIERCSVMYSARLSILLSCAIVALAVTAACNPSGTSDRVSRGDSDIPAAVEPSRLNPDQFEGLEGEAVREAMAELDVFVLTSLGLEKDDEPPERDEEFAPVVLGVKTALAHLFYDVNFDKALHPAHDPEFYATLVQFERAAGLNVDGTFTMAEADDAVGQVLLRPASSSWLSLANRHRQARRHILGRDSGRCQGAVVLQSLKKGQELHHFLIPEG